MRRKTETAVSRLTQWLPMTRAEMDARGWDMLDVLFISGDAYVDHPSFGVALLGRWLVSHGYRVGIVAQPRWDTVADVFALGRPRLFVGVSAGALDSMLAHYTAFRKKRHDDAYTPGGLAGARPNRACIVYANLVRQAFPGVPVVLGGIEASLRRVTHYDFWTDALRRSILLDAKADLLVYGMAERAILDIADRLQAGESLQGIPGTAWVTGKTDSGPSKGVLTGAEVDVLPPHEAIVSDSRKLMELALLQERQVHQRRWASQSVGGRTVWITPPAAPLTTAELDSLYVLPWTRQAHPRYTASIPALEMIQFSITAHRGCGGGCSFCSLALHQGRQIASRSIESIQAEATTMTQHPDWRGSITDIGGPSANMWNARCTATAQKCNRSSCLHPSICPNFQDNQTALTTLLASVAHIPGVKHVRVASGIRHDLALRAPRYARELVRRYTGGQIKLAPEHFCDHVLRLMRKPPFDLFLRFLTIFEVESAKAGKQQYVVPYLMTGFPGCTDVDTRRMVEWFRKQGWKPKQVQCFIPTPGTVATAMYYAGIDPAGHPIFVAKTDAERLHQHHILIPVPRGRDE